MLSSLPPVGTKKENPFKTKCFDLFKPSVIPLHRQRVQKMPRQRDMGAEGELLHVPRHYRGGECLCRGEIFIKRG